MNQGNNNVNRKFPGMTKPKLYFLLSCVAWELFCFRFEKAGKIDSVSDAFWTYLLSQMYCMSTASS